jgi:hypothetical protein
MQEAMFSLAKNGICLINHGREGSYHHQLYTAEKAVV